MNTNVKFHEKFLCLAIYVVRMDTEELNQLIRRLNLRAISPETEQSLVPVSDSLAIELTPIVSSLVKIRLISESERRNRATLSDEFNSYLKP